MLTSSNIGWVNKWSMYRWFEAEDPVVSIVSTKSFPITGGATILRITSVLVQGPP